MFTIVLISAGNEPQRTRNFFECLSCIKKQTLKDYELLIVEQTLNGSFYRNGIEGTTHIPLKNRRNDFNLSWCRNVGIMESKTNQVVLMDSDFIFKENYFEEINKITTPFASGASKFLWAKYPETEEYYRTKDITVFDKFQYKAWPGFYYPMGVTMGGILVINKNWFVNEIGGFIESFEGYGAEDNEFFFRAMAITGKKWDQFERVNQYCIHLNHEKAPMSNTPNNISFKDKLKTMDQREISNKIKQAGFGKLTGPTYPQLGI